ncbi:MAG: ELM1/GtrOC1 family putative glycosyltransferase [Pseudomonadota bacterium]
MTAPSDPSPHVWALLGHRVGDNAQIKALADRLGWRADVKTLDWRRPKPLWTPFYGRRRTLAPLAPHARADFSPPWPDLVLSIGWRSVPIARWVGQQSGATLVHLGRPRAPLAAFDLLLTTPQYGVPDAPNVLRLPGPLGGPSPQDLAAAGNRWRDRLAHLPKPWIAVLLGGNAPPLVFRVADGAKLGGQVNAHARASGGSLLVATGPRTDPAATDALAAQIDVPAHLFRWGDTDDNPYQAYLALADEFVVTGDSISMMHEVSQTGRPMHIFPLPRRLPLPKLTLPITGLATLRRQGLLKSPRNADAFSDALITAGRAVHLGTTWTATSLPSPIDPMDAAVKAVTALISKPR